VLRSTHNIRRSADKELHHLVLVVECLVEDSTNQLKPQGDSSVKLLLPVLVVALEHLSLLEAAVSLELKVKQHHLEEEALVSLKPSLVEDYSDRLNLRVEDLVLLLNQQQQEDYLDSLHNKHKDYSDNNLKLNPSVANNNQLEVEDSLVEQEQEVDCSVNHNNNNNKISQEVYSELNLNSSNLEEVYSVTNQQEEVFSELLSLSNNNLQEVFLELANNNQQLEAVYSEHSHSNNKIQVEDYSGVPSKRQLEDSSDNLNSNNNLEEDYSVLLNNNSRQEADSLVEQLNNSQLEEDYSVISQPQEVVFLEVNSNLLVEVSLELLNQLQVALYLEVSLLNKIKEEVYLELSLLEVDYLANNPLQLSLVVVSLELLSQLEAYSVNRLNNNQDNHSLAKLNQGSQHYLALNNKLPQGRHQVSRL